MTMVKLGFEKWALRNTEEDLLNIVQSNCLKIISGTCLTDCKSKNKLYKIVLRFHFLEL